MRVEELQLADIAASATFAGFEPDDFGYTEPRYIQMFASRLYRSGQGRLVSYGLKIHPELQTTSAASRWVAAL